MRKGKPIILYVSDDFRKKLKSDAALKGVTMAAAIKEAVCLYFNWEASGNESKKCN